MAGAKVTGAEPVPVRFTACGLFAALSLNVNVPVREPVAVGEKMSPTVHVAPAAMLVPQLLDAIAKSPLGAMLENASALFLWFVRVTDLAALAFPTATVPKFRLATESVTGVVPAPVKEAVRGPRLAESVTTSVPVSAPTIVGLKSMRMVQLAPPAKVAGLSGQVPPACANSPLTTMLLIVSGTVWTFFSVSVFVALIVP